MKSTSTEIPFAKTELSKFVSAVVGSGEDNVAVISDVHLGHGRVWASTIVDGLEVAFDEERMKAIRALIISGDLFDKRLHYDSDDARVITRWMERLCRLAKRHGVSIIILEGTPSHDHRQSRWMLHCNEMSGANADVRYYEGIQIDELWPGGPTCLFIQDEANHDANKTWKQVCDLMKEKGLTMVDFAVMHGMFTFQEPIRSVSSHSEERYESIVRHRIIIGHHHFPAAFGKIRVPGSVERLRFNEEHAKGHYQFTYSVANGVTNETFIINEKATIFTTFDVVGWKYDKVVALMKKHQHAPPRSNYRFKLSRVDETYTGLSRIKAMFPQFSFHIKVIEATAKAELTDNLIDTPVMTSIRPDSLSSLLLPRFEGVSDEVMAVIRKKLAA